MLFNSIEYLFFLPVVFGLYWMIPRQKLKMQNVLLLVASYFFYSCWDVRFLALLAFSTFLDFYTGAKIYIANSALSKKLWLTLSVVLNLGFLGFFKYYNFFAESLADLLRSLGFHPSFTLLNIILPVGISFYTFHGLSYVFDIYRDKVKPSTKIVDYALFVSFFPLLVAGPIERATHLLPQVQSPRKFDALQFSEGLRQILWGLFKKVIIADNCAQYSALVFNNYEQMSGGALLMGAIFFMFEVYGDFGGYSDIALGSAKLFGFQLLQNFSYPYFSRSITEFWSRWHISLSSWFRDYVYIPLGGGYGSKWLKARNVTIVFLLSGFWHGASFNRIAWGALHAIFMLPGLLRGSRNKTPKDIVASGKLFPSFLDLVKILATFFLCTLALIVFRTLSLRDSYVYLKVVFVSLFQARILQELFVFWRAAIGWTPVLLLFMLLVIEWLNREKSFALSGFAVSKPRWVRWFVYILLLGVLFVFANRSRQFIYFQF